MNSGTSPTVPNERRGEGEQQCGSNDGSLVAVTCGAKRRKMEYLTTTTPAPPAPAPLHEASLRRLIRDNRGRDWSLVIARATSHPHEARQCYFPGLDCDQENSTMGAGDTGSDVHDESIHSYLPLHALLKYNPPLEAVEAVVRACPGAVRCVTFEGSALKIAALCGSSAQVLRFLLVAEISTRKKPHNKFTGYNPIRWISEPGIKAKTAALLLKFYPQGAFQRPRSGGDLCDGVEDEFDVESPLIQIADAFARDRLGRHEDLRLDGQCELEYSSRSERERRWEKFLYILFATDCALQSRGERREAKAREDTTFYPVHAFLRCLTEPKLSLCEVRPYGCW